MYEDPKVFGEFLGQRLFPTLSVFGFLIRTLRMVADVTMYEMAKDLGMKSSELSAFEVRREKPTEKEIFTFQNYFERHGLNVPVHVFKTAAENDEKRLMNPYGDA